MYTSRTTRVSQKTMTPEHNITKMTLKRSTQQIFRSILQTTHSLKFYYFYWVSKKRLLIRLFRLNLHTNTVQQLGLAPLNLKDIHPFFLCIDPTQIIH